LTSALPWLLFIQEQFPLGGAVGLADAEAKDEGRMMKDETEPQGAANLRFIILHSYFFLQKRGLPRIRTEFSPVKSRDFTVKVCNPDGRL
jgi:hypothetical protein